MARGNRKQELVETWRRSSIRPHSLWAWIEFAHGHGGTGRAIRRHAEDISSISTVVSFPDLLAKAYLAKALTAFGKTFVRRSGTEVANI